MREAHQRRKYSYWLISLFIRIKIITTTGHHNDGSRGISAYVNDPKKNLRNAHIINKSYIVHRKLTHRHHSAGSPLRGSAFALSIRTYGRRACCT